MHWLVLACLLMIRPKDLLGSRTVQEGSPLTSLACPADTAHLHTAVHGLPVLPSCGYNTQAADI